MAAHQAPPSLGFTRQEHWSGLPFPSPMHESEKWKCSCSVVSERVCYKIPPWLPTVLRIKSLSLISSPKLSIIPVSICILKSHRIFCHPWTAFFSVLEDLVPASTWPLQVFFPLLSGILLIYPLHFLFTSLLFSLFFRSLFILFPDKLWLNLLLRSHPNSILF